MPATPSRQQREQEQEKASRDAGRLANESKFTEFRMGCDAGSAHACTSLGEWFSAMRADFPRAAALYTDACVEQRHAQACLNLGMILASGRPGVPASHAQAIEVLSLGCEAGNADACSEAGRLLLKTATRAAAAAAAPSGAPTSSPSPSPSPNAGLAPAVARADALFATGCNVASGTASNARCCGLRAALHLAPALAHHLPPPPREDLLRWLELGCAGEHGASCMALAAAYRPGASAAGAALQLPPSPARAFALEVQGLQWMGMTPRAAAAAVEKKHGPAPQA